MGWNGRKDGSGLGIRLENGIRNRVALGLEVYHGARSVAFLSSCKVNNNQRITTFVLLAVRGTSADSLQDLISTHRILSSNSYPLTSSVPFRSDGGESRTHTANRSHAPDVGDSRSPP